MPLAEQQYFLSVLLTHEDIRNKFFEAPEKVGRDYSLSKEEIKNISLISREDMVDHAEGLIYKREGLINKNLAIAYEVWGKKLFTDIFVKFGKNNPKFTSTEEGIPPYIDEIKRFYNFVMDECSDMLEPYELSALYYEFQQYDKPKGVMNFEDFCLKYKETPPKEEAEK